MNGRGHFLPDRSAAVTANEGRERSVCFVCPEILLCCLVLTWPKYKTFGSVRVSHVKHSMCLGRSAIFVGLQKLKLKSGKVEIFEVGKILERIA